MGEEILDNKGNSFFKMYIQRVMRLKEETQVLREYAAQIQDLYNSEISIRQNDVMKVLTIVTTIVLPLSLITSWYGMNFKYMPELDWKYGYFIMPIISIIIIILCLWIFKKKKFW